MPTIIERTNFSTYVSVSKNQTEFSCQLIKRYLFSVSAFNLLL